MGINYYNMSGYADPTAHAAVRNLEAQEKTLKIVHPNGQICIWMDSAFPATLDRAKKYFRLMAKYSSREDMKKLDRFLQDKESKCRTQAEQFRRHAQRCEKKTEAKQFESMAKSADSKARRTQSNHMLLVNICHMEESA